MTSNSAIRLLLPTALLASMLALAGSGCELIASVDRTKISGSGGTGAEGGGGAGPGGGGGTPCDPAACDAMDEECVDFACNADNTACESTAVAEGMACLSTTDNICDANGQCVCDPVFCDGMDQECLDVACNAENTACDMGTPIGVGQPCLLTTSDVCDDQGMCVGIECTNGFQDGEETDVDCGGSMCSGCDNGQMCALNSDCRSNNCDGTVCQPCTDAGNDCNGVADTYCDDENANNAEHVCKPQLMNGTACDATTYGDEQCLNDHCQPDDGVCCDTACDGADCESCLGASTGGTDGTCAPVTAGTDPDNDCTQSLGGSAVNGCEGDTCSGTGASCAAATSGECRPAAGVCDLAESCDGSQLGCPSDAKSTVVCNPSVGACDIVENCDGSGNNCPSDVVQSDGFDTMGMCSGFLCDGNVGTCPTTCSSGADCESGYFCNGSNVCELQKVLGASCGGNNECQNNQCVDGFCCSATSCATCEECNGAGGTCQAVPQFQQDDDSCNGAGQVCDGDAMNPTCRLQNGELCPNGVSDCASGFCADGVCCDTACTGKCQACIQSITPQTSNGICDFTNAGTNPGSDCGSTGTCVGGAALCQNVATGDACEQNSECTSNMCDTMAGVCQ